MNITQITYRDNFGTTPRLAVSVPCPPWGLDLTPGERPETEPNPRCTLIKRNKRAEASRYGMVMAALREIEDESY